MLDNKKTYLISAAIIAYALIGFFLGKIDMNTAIMEILAGLGLGAVRHSISKIA